MKKATPSIKSFLGTALKALILMVVFGSIGIAVNGVSSKPLPWVYVPPTTVEIAGLKVPLIDEKTAFEYFGDPSTTFVDTRKPEHYDEGHVKGSLSLPARNIEDRFLLLEPLLPKENRLVLYCYGPECEDAEKVASFLIPMDYQKIVIMSPGFPGWSAAGYPVETRGGKRVSGSKD